jgi:integrase
VVQLVIVARSSPRNWFLRRPGRLLRTDSAHRLAGVRAIARKHQPDRRPGIRTVLTGTRYHDLRHFYASALIAANLNPKVIQARLGHASITETMDTSGHLFPDSEDLGRGAVEAALGDALAEQQRNRSAR